MHWDKVSFLEIALLYGAGYLMLGEWFEQQNRQLWARRARGGGATIVCGGTFLQIVLKGQGVDTSMRGWGWVVLASIVIIGLAAIGSMYVKPMPSDTQQNSDGG